MMVDLQEDQKLRGIETDCSMEGENQNNNNTFETSSRLISNDSTAKGLNSNESEPVSRVTQSRILVGFWLLGLCNNFAYVVMLSAAVDILSPPPEQSPTKDPCQLTNYTSPGTHHLLCNTTGTGSILLADILPCLVIKLTAPFYMHKFPYNWRVLVAILLSATSFIIVAVAGSGTEYLSIFGVVCASLSSGLGEFVFLSLSSHFSKQSISTWSSGTGAAGIFGSVAYACLTQIGIPPNITLYILLVVPLLEAISYYWLIVKPPAVQGWTSCCTASIKYQPLTSNGQQRKATSNYNYTFLQMAALMKPLLKYMIPLSLVYAGEYFINQALFELVYFEAECGWLTVHEQYRWYQTIYQVGVFLSRSSVSCFTIRWLWILPILQFINVAILQCQVLFHYMPAHHGIWIVFALILWEGTLGGTAYANTFFKISEEILHEHREFSLGAASMGDSIGIVAAAFASIGVHNLICGADISWTYS